MPRTSGTSGTKVRRPMKKLEKKKTPPTRVGKKGVVKKAEKTAAKKAATKPATKPAQKVGTKSVGTKSVGTKSVGTKSVGTKSVAKKSVAKKSVAKKSVAKGSAGAKRAGAAKATAGRARRDAGTAPRLVHATLTELKPRLRALPDADVVAPTLPVERLVAEGVELASVAWRDLQKLSSAGLDRTIVIQLGKRAQALSEAQAELVALRSRGRSSEEEDLIEESRELRSEVLSAGRLALRADPLAQSKLDDIAEGESLDDLLQDLQDLAAVLRTYPQAFAKVGLKPSTLASWAEVLWLRLGKLLAERRAGDESVDAAKDLRDRAATYLSDAIALTRATGAYVFRKDPRRLLSYRSAYYAEHRARSERANKPATPPAPVTPPAPPAPVTPPVDPEK